MPKNSYFSQYESPNIVVVPTVSFHCSSPQSKKKKIDNSDHDREVNSQASEKYAYQECIASHPNVSNSNDINRDLNEKATKSNDSWASNDVQSIGHINKNPLKVNMFLSKDKTVLPTQDTKVKNCDQTKLESCSVQNKLIRNKPLNMETHNEQVDLTITGNINTKKDAKNKTNSAPSKRFRNDVMSFACSTENIHKSLTTKMKAPKDTTLNNSQPLHNTNNNEIKDKVKKKQLRTLHTKTNSTSNQNKSKLQIPNKETPKLKQLVCSRDVTAKNYSTEKDQYVKKSLSASTVKVNANVIPKGYLDSGNKKLNNKYLCKNKCENTSSPIEAVSEIKNMPKQSKAESNVQGSNTYTFKPDSSQLNNSYKDESEMNKSVKSVVQVIERFDLNKTQNQTSTNNNFDLRSKLKRKNLTSKERHKKTTNNSRTHEIPREKFNNLVITVQQNGEKVDAKSPLKNKAPKTKYKTKNCKKIKLVINVICQKRLDSSTESSSSSATDSDSEACSLTKDLSFLDDFNVDEIVECLKYSQNESCSAQQQVNEQFEVNDHINNSSINSVRSLSPTKNETIIKNDKILSNYEMIAKELTEKSTEIGVDIVLDQRSGKINNNQEYVKQEYNTHHEENVKEISKNYLNTDEIKFENEDQSLFSQATKEGVKINHNIFSNFSEQVTGIKEERHSLALNNSDKTVQHLNHNFVSENTEVTVTKHEVEVYPLNECDVITVQQLNGIINENDQQVITLEDDDQPKQLSDKKTETERKNNHTIVSVTTQEIDNISKTPEVKTTIHDKQITVHVEEMSISHAADVKEGSEDSEMIDVIVTDDVDQPASSNIQNSDNVQQIPTAQESINTKISRNINSIICQEVHTSSKQTENIQTVPEKVNDSKPIVKSEETTNGQSESKETSNMEMSIATLKEGGKKVPTNIKPQANSGHETNNDLQSMNVVNIKNSISEENSPNNNNKSGPKMSPKKATTFLSQQDKIIAEKLEKRMHDYLDAECTIISLIRDGKFSKIYRCVNYNGDNYAIKMLNNKCRRTVGVYKQKMLMQLEKDIPKDNLNCIHIINGFGLDGYWCYLMEYYPKNLKQALKARNKPFHINEVQDLSRQLVSAVTILRNNNIVHADIKPAHILLNSTNNKLKLCGFDSSYKNDCVRLLPNIGTVNYRAPEIILGYSTGYSIDVWSTALVMYEMATNSMFFPGIYNNDILFQQMYTFGNISYDMMQKSFFLDSHFIGTAFTRRYGFRGKQYILMHQFHKMNVIGPNLFRVYNELWSNTKNKLERLQDLCKIDSLYKLLEGMLCIDPLRRLPIEFVCANPFLYKKFM